MQASQNDNWISLEEAATYLGIKEVTLRNWIKQGKDVPANRIGKLCRFKRTELDEWVKKGCVASNNKLGTGE